MNEREWLPGSTLRDLIYDPEWFSDGESGQVLVRYYVPVLVAGADLRRAETFEAHRIAGVPFRIGIAELKDQPYKSYHYQWTSTAERTQALLVEAIQREVPESLYVFLSTPLQAGQDDLSAGRLLDRFVTLLRYAFGTNFLYQLAREAVVELPSGEMITASPIIPTPQEADGPTFSEPRRRLLGEVITALESAPGEIASRCRLALELFERAAQERAGMKFFFYWIGIEVACADRGMQAILNRLVTAYGEDRAYVQNTLGFQRIWDLRTDLVHFAQEHEMPQDVETYIRAMCMDLVRLELGLRCLRHMEELVSAGFEVERLRRGVGKSRITRIRVEEADDPSPEPSGG